MIIIKMIGEFLDRMFKKAIKSLQAHGTVNATGNLIAFFLNMAFQKASDRMSNKRYHACGDSAAQAKKARAHWTIS